MLPERPPENNELRHGLRYVPPKDRIDAYAAMWPAERFR